MIFDFHELKRWFFWKPEEITMREKEIYVLAHDNSFHFYTLHYAINVDNMEVEFTRDRAGVVFKFIKKIDEVVVLTLYSDSFRLANSYVFDGYHKYNNNFTFTRFVSLDKGQIKKIATSFNSLRHTIEMAFPKHKIKNWNFDSWNNTIGFEFGPFSIKKNIELENYEKGNF